MDKDMLRLVAFAVTAAVVMLTVRAGHADQASANETPAVMVRSDAGEVR